MLGDPEQIRQLGQRLAAEADRVRWLARRLSQVDDVAWQSPAAHAFRSRVAEHVRVLGRCGADLDASARRVAVHAQAVEEARAEVLRVAALGASVADLAGAAVREVVVEQGGLR
jgi:hypothetical protein